MLVLYLGNAGTAAQQHYATLMREFEREAICFDYTSDTAQLIPEGLWKFDAVLLDAARADFAALPEAAAKQAVGPEAAGHWSDVRFLGQIRERLLATLSAERRRSREQFLAQREP